VSDSVKVGDREWSLEGVPEHMIRALPHTAVVTVRQPIYDGGRTIGYTDIEHVVQLERDGKPLTRADIRPSWTC
jgi:hypothetical protein